MSSKIGSYKGHPVIELGMAGEERGFVFGLKKARTILENLEDIRAFVGEQGGDKGAVNRQISVKLSVMTADSRAVRPAIAHAGGEADWENVTDAMPLASAVTGAGVNEDILRAEPVCRGCGGDKAGQGLLVCWDCFKRHPVAPLQTASLSVGDWLARYGRKGGAK